MAFFDFFGFGSKRRTALRSFDAALTAGKVNPAYMDDGMRYVIYKWATEEEASLGLAPSHVDARLAQAAALLSFCVLGPEETEREFGAQARDRGQALLDGTLAEDRGETFETKVVKLALARGIAAPDIAAQVELV